VTTHEPEGAAAEASWTPAPTVQRLRLTFAKREAIRFIAHLDLQRTWERTLRRARIPLAHTAGFNPRPRLGFAAPLGLGAVGEQELLDVWLREPRTPAAAATAIRASLPPGLDLLAVEQVPLDAPTLASRVRGAAYRAELWHDEPLDRATVEERVRALLARESIPRQRERVGKSLQRYDLRPTVLDISVLVWDDAAERRWLGMRLRAGSEVTGRPQDVLAELGLEARLLVRERLVLDD
jgi:radical SAM-linked protein